MATDLTVASQVLKRRIKNRRLPNLNIPQTGQVEVDRALKQVQEHLQLYEGSANAPRQRFVTIEDLEQAGLISITEKQGFAAITKVLGSDTPKIVTDNPKKQVVVTIDSQNINTLDGIGNVSTGGKKTRDFLYWNGTAWTPYNLFGNQNLWTGRQQFQDGVLELFERADGPEAQAGRGYIWLDDASPNVLYFRNDAGTDINLTTGGSGLSDVVDDLSPQLGGNLESNSNDIRMADNDVVSFGTGQDASFYWDGTDLRLDVNDATGDFILRLASAAEPAIYAVANGAVSLYYNGGLELQTQQYNATGNTTGANVRSHDASYYDVGFNVLPKIRWNDDLDLGSEGEDACGHVWGKSDSGAETLTGPTSSELGFPVEGVLTIKNLNASGNLTLNDTATCTMYVVDGGTITDIAGTATVGPGGIVTMWRESAGAIYLYGSELSP